MTILKELYWIAIDWGSSNLRVWALNNNNAILDSILSNDGMLGLASNEFEPLLLKKYQNGVLEMPTFQFYVVEW